MVAATVTVARKGMVVSMLLLGQSMPCWSPGGSATRKNQRYSGPKSGFPI